MSKSTQQKLTQAILVAGMHRSGTSALTRIISILGAELPKNLMPSVKGNNETGFWESKDLEKLHDEVLESAGSSWDDWSEFNPDWYETTTAQTYKQQLLKYLKKDFAESPQFVIKDPRICRFLPLWIDVSKEHGSQPFVIIPFRNPLEVAESLKARDGMSVSKGLLLWLRHVIDAVHDSDDTPRVFVSFDNLLQDWEGSIDQISKQSGVKWSRKSVLAELQIEDFIDHGQKHQSRDELVLEKNNSIPSFIVDAYAALQALEENNKDKIAKKTIERIRLDFNQRSLIFSKVVLHEKIQLIDANNIIIKDLEEKNNDLHADLLSLQSGNIQKDQQLKELQEEFDDINRVNNNAHLELTKQRKAAVNLEYKLTGKIQDIYSLQEELSSKEIDSQLLERNLQDQKITLQDQKITLRDQISTLEVQISTLKGKLSTNKSKIQLLEQALLEKSDLIILSGEKSQSLEEQVTDMLNTIDSLNAQLQEKETEYGHLNKTYHDEMGLMNQKVEQLEQERQEIKDFYTHYIEDKNSQLEQARYLSQNILQSEKQRRKYSQYLAVKPSLSLFERIKKLIGSKKGRNFLRDKQLILKSGLFDPHYYLINNPDVLKSGISPLEHFYLHGWKEFRNPHPEFDVKAFVENHPQVTINPLVYYLLYIK